MDIGLILFDFLYQALSIVLSSFTFVVYYGLAFMLIILFLNLFRQILYRR